ncbi:unnamed protein product [Zymoseptoria tritici ST99CH_1A5]|uniref:Peptidase M3A/M3B catalytic domain-containing protein n=1 Tax=Zymoseptoria tritici ST99CH_1A5 TaxID=1276529 RepID=A0A1Y6L5P6_ZYMTR|nr:unnamed protein product [Zymoseptoria tritici ST99CH_1A5]
MAHHGIKSMTLFLISALVQLGHSADLPHPHEQTRRDVDTLSSGLQRPPQAPFVWNDTAESVKQIGIEFTANAQTTVQNILASVATGNATFDNVILPYMQTDNINTALLYPLSAYAQSDKKDVTEATNEVQANLSAVYVEIYTNEKLFQLVDTVYQANVNDTELSEEQQIVLKNLWGSFSDLTFSPTQRDYIHDLEGRVGDAASKFAENANAPAPVYFTAEELEGVPTELLNTFDKTNATGDNAGKLSFDANAYSVYVAVMTSAVNATTRYTLFLAQSRIAPENEPILEEYVRLQLQIAQFYNYTSYADYALAANIAQNHTRVNAFLEEIRTNIVSHTERDVADIAQTKQNDTTAVSLVGERDIAYQWDGYIYPELEKENLYNVNVDKIKEYFPVNFTIPALLSIYGEIYGLRFDRIEGKDADDLSPTGKGDDLVYDPSLLMFAVWDDDKNPSCASANISDRGFRGYLYLDLFYRPPFKSTDGGFENMFSPGYRKPDGTLHYPSVRVITNFIRSENEALKPSLIKYSDLGVVFHELGHGMHDLLSVTNFTRTHGTFGVPVDFVEFPAQFMENYPRRPEAVKRIARHWSSLSPQAAEAWRKEQSDPNAPLPPATLPDDIAANVVSTSLVRRSLDQMRLVAFSTNDQQVFQATSIDEINSTDYVAIFNDKFRNLTGLEDPSDLGQGDRWGYPALSFTSYVNQYGGSLYTYLWCQSYAEDVFATKFAADPFNSDEGMRYRTQVLQYGGARDPAELLREYLGRDPNLEAFIKFANGQNF